MWELMRANSEKGPLCNGENLTGDYLTRPARQKGTQPPESTTGRTAPRTHAPGADRTPGPGPDSQGLDIASLTKGGGHTLTVHSDGFDRHFTNIFTIAPRSKSLAV